MRALVPYREDLVVGHEKQNVESRPRRHGPAFRLSDRRPPRRRPIPRPSTFLLGGEGYPESPGSIDTGSDMADAFDTAPLPKRRSSRRHDGFVGSVLGDIPEATFEALTGGTGRGEVGHAIEAFFGIPQNSLSMPDFPGARIELKVVPLRLTGRWSRREGTNGYLPHRLHGIDRRDMGEGIGSEEAQDPVRLLRAHR